MNENKKDEEYWIRHKTAWEKSGLSQRSYSIQEGLCNKKFNYHIKRQEKKSAKLGFKFIEAPNILAKRPVEKGASFRVELPNGVAVVIELTAKMTLAQVLEVAGAL